MSHPDELLDTDFEAQLRGLFQQAERAIEGRAAAEKHIADETNPAAPAAVAGTPVVPAPTSAANGSGQSPAPAQTGAQTTSQPSSLSLPQMLKPIVLGLEAVSRATTENNTLLKRLDTSTTEAGKQLPAVVADLRTLIELKNGISQSMFAALHEELKGYKDGFLLDSVHRPIIRDLISLYDDTAEIRRQVSAAITDAKEKQDAGKACSALLDRIRTIEVNLGHHMEFIREVLNRLEVAIMPPNTGKLDKHSQRAVVVEMAEDQEQDGTVVRALKPGFMWKDRIFRPEEVVIRKWKEGFLVALKSEAKQ
jgi:molecular chaperone GrpE (heat shock protein)